MASTMTATTTTTPPGDIDIALWLVAACGWSVAGMMFLIPSCYWMLVHGLAVVGFFSIATGRTKTVWPPFEHAVATLQRLIGNLQNNLQNTLTPSTLPPSSARPPP